VADIDHDGWPEIVIGGDCAGAPGQPCYNGVPFQNRGGYVWVLSHDGVLKPGWPKFVPGQTVWSSPVVADLFNDDRSQIVSGTGLNYAGPAGSAVYAWDVGGGLLPGFPVAVGGRVVGTPAIGDLDGDGLPDIAVMADDGRIYAMNAGGHMLPGWPQCAASNRSACPVPLHGTVSIADVLGNGHQQVIAGGEQWVRVWNGSGGAPVAELVTQSGTEPLSAAPTIANIGGSSWIVQTATFENGAANQGHVWIWAIPGQAPGYSAWPTAKHDSHRTGVGFVGSVPTARGVGRLAGTDRFGTAAAISQATYQPGVPVAYVATFDALKGHAARVDRIAGKDRYDTSAMVSADAFTPGVPVAYVATGNAFPDALAGGAAAAHLGGPMLLVPGDSVPASVETELIRLQPRAIVVLGGPAAVSDAVVAQMSLRTSPPGNARRVSGANRYETATAVAADAFASWPSVFIATGRNFPDALAGGVLAGRAASPLLLVADTTVPVTVRTALNKMRPAKATILGGPGAVNDLVEYQVGY
jgi:putative cell wall-binding protein